MGTEAHPQTTSPTPAPVTPVATNGVGAPAQAGTTPTPAVTPAPAATPAAAAPVAPVTPAVPVERIPTRKLLGDDDSDIPADAELIEMKPSQLKKRLERATAKEMRERFGTDDPTVIQQKLAKFAEYEKADHERRLAEMTETQRLQAKLDAEIQRASTAESRLKEIEETRVVEAEDRRVQGLAGKYINPRYLVTEIPRLAHFLGSCSAEELANPDAVIEEWFKTSVAEMPWLHKDFGQPVTPAVGADPAAAGAPPATAAPVTPAAPVAKVPMSNGAPNAKPDNQQSPVTTWAQKTAAPGKPNSMTASEWQEYRRLNGIQY